MQTYPEQFPQERRADPMRRAEARVFDAISASPRPGFAYYEWKRGQDSPELDFALWIQDEGRLGLQVKGGLYSLEGGKWHLTTERGREKKPSPLRRTWDATMSLRDEVSERLAEESYFIAVLLFPDMEPDAAIAEMARRSHVQVLWGTDNLVSRLVEIADRAGVYYPPGAGDIRREVAAVTDGQIVYLGEDPDRDQPQAGPPAPAEAAALAGTRLEIPAGGIIIHRVDTLIVHAAPGPAPDAGDDQGVQK